MSNTLITWAAIAIGSWIVLAALIAPRIGRALARFDEAQDDDTEPDYPPLPRTLLVVTEDDYDADLPAWLFDVPSQPLTDDEFTESEALLRGVA